jgi:hypothetical protein
MRADSAMNRENKLDIGQRLGLPRRRTSDLPSNTCLLIDDIFDVRRFDIFCDLDMGDSEGDDDRRWEHCQVSLQLLQQQSAQWQRAKVRSRFSTSLPHLLLTFRAFFGCLVAGILLW